MPLFGPPDVEKLKTRGDVKGLVKALDYKKDSKLRRDAAAALRSLDWQPGDDEPPPGTSLNYGSGMNVLPLALRRSNLWLST